jgi:hypothetical protein
MEEDPIFRNPRFAALQNALYHTERRAFLDRANKLMNSMVIILTAGVVAKAAHMISVDGAWTELAVVVVATLQMVFDFGGSAQEHKFLQMRYYEMLSQMEEEGESGPEFEKRWSARLLKISADEKLLMRALSAITFNMALDAIFAETENPELRKDYRQSVAWYHWLFRNIFAFHTTNFQPHSGHRTHA